MIWTVIKAVLVILPAIIDMVRNGKVKEATLDEVLKGLEGRLNARIQRAKEAEKDIPDEADDPYNRSR